MDTGEAVRARAAWAAAALFLGAMAWPALSGKVYTYDDLGGSCLPGRVFYARCLAAGDSFLWWPNIYCGFYLHGEGFVGMCHPMHLALYRALPIVLAFHAEFVASYVALLGGMYLLLRRWGVARDAATLGAIVFALGGFNMAHYMHIVIVAAVAHLPWFLLAIDGLMRADSWRRAARWGVALSALTASQILLAHPQFIWISGLAEAGYVVFLWAGGCGGLGRAAALVVAKVVGVLGGAAQILPTLDVMRRSDRASPSRELLAMGSLPPGNLVQGIAPYLYRARVFAPTTHLVEGIVMGPAPSTFDWRTHEFGFYAGTIVPALLAWLWLRRRGLAPWARRLAIGAAVLASAGFLLAVGDHLPLFELTHRLPGFGLFRVPARHVVLVDLAAAILVALAFDDLARSNGPMPWRSLLPLAVVAVLGVAVPVGVSFAALAWPKELVGEHFGSAGAIVAGAAMVVGSAALVAAAARGRRGALLGLVVLVASDQAAFGLSYLRQLPAVTIDALAAGARWPPEMGKAGTPGDVRIRAFDNRLTIRGARLTEGYTSFTPIRRLDYREVRAQRVAGSLWMKERTESPGWSRVPSPLPRARLVTQYALTNWPDLDLPKVDPVLTALVEQPLDLTPGEPGTAQILRDRPGRISLATHARTAQLLVLSESWHEGWTVAVDGQSRPVVRTYGDFLGVVVEPGSRLVQFRFAPRSFRFGLGLTAASCVIMAGVLAGSFTRVRSRASGPVGRA